MARLKAEAADAVVEKRKEVMYKIKDLKIEIGTTFKKAKKAEKKAKIESLVSELESFINKTIRDYDEAIADQIQKLASSTAAAATALATERAEAEATFEKKKGPAADELDEMISEELEKLGAALTEKVAAASEVSDYLSDNFGSYFSELLEHALANASDDERDDLLAFTLMPTDPADPTS